ncbi:hypothetical protein WJ972_12035 [Achromobacter insuavis]
MTTKHRIIQVGSLAGSPSANQRLAERYDVIGLWKQPDRRRPWPNSARASPPSSPRPTSAPTPNSSTPCPT